MKVDCDHIIFSEWLRQSVLVFLDAERAREEIRRLAPDADVPCGNGGAGWAERGAGGALFWMVLADTGPNTILHESIHVVDYLCEFTGIPVSAENVEVRCYLTEWLFGRVMEACGHKVADTAAPALRKARRK